MTSATNGHPAAANDPIEAFYNDRPYPPPTSDLERHRRAWSDPARRRMEHHLIWPARPFQDELNVLIAGCGTSQAAKYAVCRPGARVTGIDVSATSLRCTQDLKDKYRLTQLELHDLPIERVGDLTRRFDLIVCTGVLHHLEDPAAGLAALRSVLEPDGALQLMVYGRYGRAGVYMIQEYCRLLGLGASDADVQDLGAAIRMLPRAHPLVPLLAQSRDFSSANGLADALLNPRDRSYKVPELLALLESADLAFGRWSRQAPYLPYCGAVASTPYASALAELPQPEQYAAMELWRGTFARHSVIAYASTAERERQAVRLDDGRWESYVPCRMVKTVLVQDGTPAGYAAVLLNQSHAPSTDLVLPISALEKRLYDAIDGRRTIGQIVGDVVVNQERADVTRQACAFFERLWWYDQVAFDTTGAA